jgi:hypothetical protein
MSQKVVRGEGDKILKLVKGQGKLVWLLEDANKGPEVEACGAIERIGGGGGAGAPVRPVGGTSHPVP